MKFSGKMCLLMILKVTKNHGFTFSLEDTFFEKPQGGRGVQIESPLSRFRVNQVRFKTSMLGASLCDYSNTYILVKGTITVVKETEAAKNNANKKLIFENCASFSNCISRINNTQVDNAHDIDVVMPMYDLIEYSDNYSKNIWNLMVTL